MPQLLNFLLHSCDLELRGAIKTATQVLVEVVVVELVHDNQDDDGHCYCYNDYDRYQHGGNNDCSRNTPLRLTGTDAHLSISTVTC